MREAPQSLTSRDVACLSLRISHPAWPPWGCSVAIFQRSLTSPLLFRKDRTLQPGWGVGVWRPPRPPLQDPAWAPPPKRLLLSPHWASAGTRPAPSAAADWIRNGHLTRLDQSDALPGRGLETAWRFPGVCGRPGCGSGGAPGKRPGPGRARAGAAGGEEGRSSLAGELSRGRSCHASCRRPAAGSDPAAAALPALDSEVASCSSHKSSPFPRACASGLPFGAAGPSPPAAAT